MYGKVFDSIYDGTLYGHWEAIVTMQQLIVLATPDGVVDMTPQAIAARTSIPRDILEKGLKVLSEPDPYTRTPGEEGRRIVLLDDHRPWGWRLVNHGKYMRLRNIAEKREADRSRIAEKRKRINGVASESQPVANVAHSDSDSDSIKPMDAGASRLEGFEIFWSAYPKRAGNNPKNKAEVAYKARLKEKHTPQQIIEGADRYARYVRAEGKEGTQYVLQAATFLGRDKGFLQLWPAPVDPTKPSPKRETCDYCGAPWSGKVGGIVHCSDHTLDALDGKVPLKVAL